MTFGVANRPISPKLAITGDVEVDAFTNVARLTWTPTNHDMTLGTPGVQSIELPEGFRSGDRLNITLDSAGDYIITTLVDFNGDAVFDGMVANLCLVNVPNDVLPATRLLLRDSGGSGTTNGFRIPGSLNDNQSGDYLMSSEEEGVNITFVEGGGQALWRFNGGTAAQALTGAITATGGLGGSRTTTFSGIRDNNTLETARGFLNFVSSTSNTLVCTQDSGNNEIEITAQRAALTGDVTATANSNATTIANDAVTNAKLANMAAGTAKGRLHSAGTGDPTDLTRLEQGQNIRAGEFQLITVAGGTTTNNQAITDGVTQVFITVTGSGVATFTGFNYASGSFAGAHFKIVRSVNSAAGTTVRITDEGTGSTDLNRVWLPGRVASIDLTADEENITIGRDSGTASTTRWRIESDARVRYNNIRDNGTLETSRSFLNILSTTSVVAAITADSVNDEHEVTWERAALTGAITASQNSNTTAFGTAAAKSVLANATNATAVPAFLAGSAAFQYLRVDSTNTALEWGTISVASPITITSGTIGFDQTVTLDNNARVAISKNSGATVGTRRRVNFIEGSGVTLTIADDAGNEEVDVTIAAAAGSAHTIRDNGSDETQRNALNFVTSSTITALCTDDAGNNETEATFSIVDGSVTPTHVSIFGTPTSTGIPFIIYVSYAAGAGGAADDVTIFNASAPFAFRILEAWQVTATAVGSSTVTARSASGGGGSALTTAISSTVTGKTSDNSTATTTVAASGSVFLRRSDSGVAGEFFMMCVRT